MLKFVQSGSTLDLGDVDMEMIQRYHYQQATGLSYEAIDNEPAEWVQFVLKLNAPTNNDEPKK